MAVATKLDLTKKSRRFMGKLREQSIEFCFAVTAHHKCNRYARLGNGVWLKSPGNKSFKTRGIKNSIVRSFFDLDRRHLAALRIDVQKKNASAHLA